MKKRAVIYFALGGVVGPILFTMMTLICSGLRLNYDQIHQFISELGATGTSYADLMNFVGFIPAGLMIALFGISLFQLPKHLMKDIGASLIFLFGVGVVIAGSFSCDPGCPQQGGSFENSIHDGISGPAFLSASTGILLIGFSLRRSLFWKTLWVYSLVTALFAYSFIFLLINSLDSRIYTGLWQRLLIATIFLWCGIVGLKMFNSSRGKFL